MLKKLLLLVVLLLLVGLVSAETIDLNEQEQVKSDGEVTIIIRLHKEGNVSEEYVLETTTTDLLMMYKELDVEPKVFFKILLTLGVEPKDALELFKLAYTLRGEL